MPTESMHSIVTTHTPDLARQWQTVRETLENVRHAGRSYLFGKVLLGWQLTSLKAAHQATGGGRGGDRKSMGQTVPLIDWNKLVEDETALNRRTADRLIALFEATKAKLKRVKGPIVTKGTLILFERETPLSINDEDHGELMEIISSLCDGETVGTLMAELGIIPKPKTMPKGGGGKHDDELTAGQLAFHFFEAMTSPLINARTNPDYKKLLYSLPVTSTEDHPLSLATLESECRAMLADIEDAKQAAAKPAKGRVI